MFQIRSLKGKFAVVTGAGKGIGFACTKRFLEDDIEGVAILDINEEIAQSAARNLDSNLRKAIAIGCDVSDLNDVERAKGIVLSRFGAVDIVVNNAGIVRDRIFHKMSRQEWDDVLNINLNGPFNICKAFIEGMREREYGRIVNIASISAFGNLGQANYAASKAGLLGFTKTVAIENAAKNIVANVVAPGYVKTDMYNGIPEEALARDIAKIPMNRFCEPEEIASIVAFLSSDEASFITGQCLVVSGGAQT